MGFVIVAVLPFLAFLFFAARRLRRYLHLFQQDEYDGLRFLKWMLSSFAVDKRLSLAVLILCAFDFFVPDDRIVYPLLTLAFAGFALKESDPRKDAKKKLVMTPRARRIYITALVLCVLAAVILTAIPSPWLWLAAIHALPFLLALGNMLLFPYEAHVQKRFWMEAHHRLEDINPDVIGITGSFGKTSVKHILGHVLEMSAPTLYTPGSVNTPMGVTRIIRENLKKGCQYFLVEMGAYGEKSIERLCRLTPPRYGLITAIGAAHYERYKTLDTVARAKFELAEAVIADNGTLVIDEQILEHPYAQDFVAEHRNNFVICGAGADADFQLTDITQTANGLTVRITHNGNDYELFAPLFGKHHGQNIALVFALAVTLGLKPEIVTAALRTTPQIQHRLEVKRQANEQIYIDDAFNSNPKGFANALDLMKLLQKEHGGRTILVTPGMVELGDLHDEEHRVLGAKAADCVDVAIVVKPERIEAFATAFQERAPENPLIRAKNLKEAQTWLSENAQAKDIILIENDLPDLYERKVTL